jgi:hypothetical protein
MYPIQYLHNIKFTAAEHVNNKNSGLYMTNYKYTSDLQLEHFIAKPDHSAPSNQWHVTCLLNSLHQKHRY